jgi:hypothetical protein
VDRDVGVGYPAGGPGAVAGRPAVPERLAVLAAVPAGFEPVGAFEHCEAGRRGISVTGRVAGRDPVAILDELEAALDVAGWGRPSRSSVDDELLALHVEGVAGVFNVNLVAGGDAVVVTLMLVETD